MFGKSKLKLPASLANLTNGDYWNDEMIEQHQLTEIGQQIKSKYDRLEGSKYRVRYTIFSRTKQLLAEAKRELQIAQDKSDFLEIRVKELKELKESYCTKDKKW